MSRQVSDSQTISTIDVGTTVGFTAGDYVYSYGANLIGFPKAASNNIGDLTAVIGGVAYSDYIATGLTGQQISAQGPLVDATLYSGTTRAITTPLVAAAVINAGTSHNNNVVAALQGGNYVSVYFTTATTLVAAIYDTTGTIVGSAVTISTSAVNNTSNTDTVAVAGLTDGGYVVVFTGASSYPQYVRVNSSNAITAGPTNVRAGAAYTGSSNNNNKAICGTSSGGFAIAVCSQFNTYQAYVASYNSSNAVMWAADIDAGTNYNYSYYGFDSVSIVQNGNYLQIGVVNVDYDACAGQTYLSYGLNCWQLTYNARVGTKVGTTMGVAGRSYNSKIKVCPIVGSTDAALFMLTYAYTPTTVTCFTLVQGVNQNVNFSVNAGVSTQSFWPIALAAGGFGFVYAGTDSVIKLILATKSSTAYSWTVGSAQTLYTGGVTYNAVCASGGRNGRIFVSFPNASSYPVNMQVSNFTATSGVTYITGSTSYTPETNYSLLGVALTTAAPGASGTVQTRGTAKLNAGYPAALTPSYFSYASSSYGPYGGNTGNVSGTTVTLGGL